MPEESHPPKRIAWDGVSFLIPWNWELAIYKGLKKGVTRIEIEDEYSVRMEAEWVRPKRKLHMDNILERYETKSKKLTKRADRKKEIPKLPKGWHATQYWLSETVPRKGPKGGMKVQRYGLVTAFYLCPESSLFCFVLIHFLAEDKESPRKITKLVSSEFKHHDDTELVPWELFDIEFELPKKFYLETTLFDIGYKLMVFRWRMRHFFLWHFSCTDMFLKDDVVIEEWLAAHINDSRGLPGGKFMVSDDKRIVRKRYFRHVFGHRDELSRMCFKYTARFKVDEEKKQLIAWVFHHRKQTDLEMIPKALRFDEPR